MTAKLLSFSPPRFSSREACVPKQGLQRERGPDNQPSFSGPGPPAPSRVSHGAPMKRAGGARQGGPARPGAFFPGHCSPGLPSPTSQQTGGAFSKRGLRPPLARSSKPASLSLRPGEPGKGSLCSRCSMGTYSEGCELEDAGGGAACGGRGGGGDSRVQGQAAGEEGPGMQGSWQRGDRSWE